MRLDRFLAQSGVGKRKSVREYIKEGLVKVNGRVVIEPALDIDHEKDEVAFREERISYLEKVYYMFNKPAGCVTATKDDCFKTVFDYFHTVETKGLFHVGRLDKDTEGLLFVTNDGTFENLLMSPENHVKKRYYFVALGKLNPKNIEEIERGIDIGHKGTLTKPAQLEIVLEGNYNDLHEELDIYDFYNNRTDRYEQPIVAGDLTITEGVKHQVKRMLKAVGCYVVYLKREAIGEVKLDPNLDKGQFRELNEDELKKLGFTKND